MNNWMFSCYSSRHLTVVAMLDASDSNEFCVFSCFTEQDFLRWVVILAEKTAISMYNTEF